MIDGYGPQVENLTFNRVYYYHPMNQKHANSLAHVSYQVLQPVLDQSHCGRQKVRLYCRYIVPRRKIGTK